MRPSKAPIPARTTTPALATAFLASAALALAFCGGAHAQGDKKPLVMPDKKTLLQKVITHPGALAKEIPSVDAEGRRITPFTILYVYERKDDNGVEWIQCGEGSQGRDLFWVRGNRTSDWMSSMVLVFDEKAGRQPLLFFKDKKDILEIAANPGIKGALDSLAQQFQRYLASREPPPPGFPVLAMEPTDEQGAVPKDQFYIMPIFGYDDQLEGVKLLDVASINPGDNSPDEVVSELPDKPAGGGGAGAGGGSGDGPENLRICFVIDTTMSMGPYIEETLDVIGRFYDAILKGPNAANTYLAFVAFRSSLEAAPDTEYETEVIADFTNATNRDAIEKAIDQVEEAEFSTHAFNEDSIAGMNRALDLDWTKFGGVKGGIIILISDAGPLPSSDRYSASRDDPAGIKGKAEARNVRITTIHLKTPEGRNNHRYAQDSYMDMVMQLGARSGYLDVQIPSREEAREKFAEVADNLVEAVSAYNREMGRPLPDSAEQPPKPEETPAQRAANLGALLGYSVRLDYLAARNKTTPPGVVRSWIPDKDLGHLDQANPRDVRTVKVAVLLTRSQLSALNQSVKAIVGGATELLSGGSLKFFDAVLSAAVQVGRDAKDFASNPKQLKDMGLLGEYLDGLPYQSRVMTLNQEVWDSWTPNEQREFILELEAKISRYEFIDSDRANWFQLPGMSDADAFYRVPLDALP
ncbi:MAG: VWA domain-containing protein [Deltaproteobacteria bacterium]|jgi:serine/threonine-protein kinase PpkA|nr:VWA domain-containing protein [Deltaproteobacteria bacterium]